MKSKRVTCTWEFYRDNCEGFKEPMRKELRKLDDYVSNIEAENAKLRELCLDLWASCPVHDEDCQACKHYDGAFCDLYVRMEALEVG